MKEINLREYQKPFYVNIWRSLQKNDKVCAVLPTGGGKSVIIGKLANELPGRTLVLTHRIEILAQNSEWIHKCGLLSSKIDTMRADNETIIAMVQTLHARIKKYGIEYIGKIDNIILDETHVLIFEKVFKQYNFKRLIGFTGSPVINKRKTVEIDGVEFVEPYTLSEIFDDLVQGPDSQDLIDLDMLVQDRNITLELPDFDKLKESNQNPDGYTSKSLNEVYDNSASLKILVEAYNKYCKGKKTLIFNATTKVNESVFKHFKKQGINCKMFDSVNKAEINPKTGKNFTRDEIVEWFSNERDAVLINTNVFTTGFNVTDIEVVIVNRATKSLSLWIQMVGRGSRITDKIFKDYFTVIDLGQNIYEHGRWSLKRNWKDYFYSPGLRRKNNPDMLSTWECTSCGSLNLTGETICAYCGDEKGTVVINGKVKKNKEGRLNELDDMPLPRARTIIQYTKRIGEDGNFAFKLLEQKIVDLFLHYNVSKQFYYNKKKDYIANGKTKDGFETRIRKIYTPIYFAIIKDKTLKCKRRRLDTQIERAIEKVEKLYKH